MQSPESAARPWGSQMFLLEALVQQPLLEAHFHQRSLLEVPIGPVCN